jgi:hypothetical protein
MGSESNSQNMSQNPDSTFVQCGCKIGRISKKYNHTEAIEKLGEQWLDSEEDMSLRQLARNFNQQILRQALHRTGQNPLTGEVENIYNLLTDGDVSAGDRIQVRNRLSKYGIDPDEIKDDFVSYQTVNRHIKNCLDISAAPDKGSTGLETPDAVSRIRSLQNWMAAVADRTISRSQSVQDTDSLDVIVDVNVTCRKCGMSLKPEQAIENDGCQCDREDELAAASE